MKNSNLKQNAPFPSGRIISNKLILNGALIHFGSIHQLSWDCVATTKCVIAIKIEHKNFLCFQGSSLWPNIGIYWIRFLGGILPSTYYYVVRDLSIFFLVHNDVHRAAGTTYLHVYCFIIDVFFVRFVIELTYYVVNICRAECAFNVYFNNTRGKGMLCFKLNSRTQTQMIVLRISYANVNCLFYELNNIYFQHQNNFICKNTKKNMIPATFQKGSRLMSQTQRHNR